MIRKAVVAAALGLMTVPAMADDDENLGSLRPGVVMCSKPESLAWTKSTMNQAQLDSLGCIKSLYFLKVIRDKNMYSLGEMKIIQVAVIDTDKITKVWVEFKDAWSIVLSGARLSKEEQDHHFDKVCFEVYAGTYTNSDKPEAQLFCEFRKQAKK